MGFTRTELESYIGATVPDLVGPNTRLLFVGINPGLWTAATQTHFAHPGNRYYPALFEVLLAAQQNNAFATLDCLHLYRSGGTVAELRELGRDTLTLISNVQLCDISAQPQAFNWREKLAANKAMLAAGVDGARTMGFKSMLAVSGKAHNTRDDAAVLMKEATCSRLLPGQGDIPLQDILQCLRELDCQPLMGLEISSLTMNRLSPKQAAQNAMSAYRKISVSDQASI